MVCQDGCARHLCGHDGHSGILAGLALALEGIATSRDVYLIFQPAEETGQGAALRLTLRGDLPKEYDALVNGIANKAKSGAAEQGLQ